MFCVITNFFTLHSSYCKLAFVRRPFNIIRLFFFLFLHPSCIWISKFRARNPSTAQKIPKNESIHNRSECASHITWFKKFRFSIAYEYVALDFVLIVYVKWAIAQQFYSFSSFMNFSVPVTHVYDVIHAIEIGEERKQKRERRAAIGGGSVVLLQRQILERSPILLCWEFSRFLCLCFARSTCVKRMLDGSWLRIHVHCQIQRQLNLLI